MSKNYSVKCVRISRPWFGTKHFYVPMVYDPISEKLFSLKDSDEMTSVWGYDTEAEAWKVIDEKMMQDDRDEAEAYESRGYHSRSDREDFHADG